MVLRQPGRAPRRRKGRRRGAEEEDRRPLRVGDRHLRERQEDDRTADQAPASCSEQPRSGLDASDVPRRQARLRGGHRSRTEVHARAARAGGGSVMEDPMSDHSQQSRTRQAALVGLGIGGVLVASVTLFVRMSVASAGERLANPQAPPPAVALADHSEEKYCTPQFKQVLQRVLNACGLVGGEARRGCQPADVKTLASINDADFNALFTPLKDRGAVILFDDNAEKLDPGAMKVIEDRWQDRKGARYFFVVAR